jgi:hypothetical protein
VSSLRCLGDQGRLVIVVCGKSLRAVSFLVLLRSRLCPSPNEHLHSNDTSQMCTLLRRFAHSFLFCFKGLRNVHSVPPASYQPVPPSPYKELAQVEIPLDKLSQLEHQRKSHPCEESIWLRELLGICRCWCTGKQVRYERSCRELHARFPCIFKT